jgi:3-oxoacyl-[acyl-carrier-protein] synthase-3
MRKAALAGTGTFLPGEPLGNEVVERLFGTQDNYLSTLLGARLRYWSCDPETFAVRYPNSEMAARAARVALEAAGLAPNDIQLVIVNSCTPDYLMPPMAPLVQERLNISECAVVELRSGCVGSIAALGIAAQLVSSGMYANALVVASELSSSHNLVPVREKRDLTMEERLNGIMFGDGAGALVLVADDTGRRGLERFCMNSIGCGLPPGMFLPVGGSCEPYTKEAAERGISIIHHDRRAVVRWGREMSVRALRDLCAAAGVTPDEIDCFVFPQANASLLKEDTKVIPPERVVVNVEDVGNVISAGLLIALDKVVREHRVPPAGRVALIGGEASKWLYGSALVRL